MEDQHVHVVETPYSTSVASCTENWLFIELIHSKAVIRRQYSKDINKLTSYDVVAVLYDSDLRHIPVAICAICTNT
jgi:hypothetical protein